MSLLGEKDFIMVISLELVVVAAVHLLDDKLTINIYDDHVTQFCSAAFI